MNLVEEIPSLQEENEIPELKEDIPQLKKENSPSKKDSFNSKLTFIWKKNFVTLKGSFQNYLETLNVNDFTKPKHIILNEGCEEMQKEFTKSKEWTVFIEALTVDEIQNKKMELWSFLNFKANSLYVVWRRNNLDRFEKMANENGIKRMKLKTNVSDIVSPKKRNKSGKFEK